VGISPHPAAAAAARQQRHAILILFQTTIKLFIEVKFIITMQESALTVYRFPQPVWFFLQRASGNIALLSLKAKTNRPTDAYLKTTLSHLCLKRAVIVACVESAIGNAHFCWRRLAAIAAGANGLR
jgi:hypothetical protein